MLGHRLRPSRLRTGYQESADFFSGAPSELERGTLGQNNPPDVPRPPDFPQRALPGQDPGRFIDYSNHDCLTAPSACWHRLRTSGQPRWDRCPTGSGRTPPCPQENRLNCPTLPPYRAIALICFLLFWVRRPSPSGRSPSLAFGKQQPPEIDWSRLMKSDMGQSGAHGRPAGGSLHVRRDRANFGWNREFPPAVVVSSGSTVTLHTVDSSGGQITSKSTSENIGRLDFGRVNPVSGPVRSLASDFWLTSFGSPGSICGRSQARSLPSETASRSQSNPSVAL